MDWFKRITGFDESTYARTRALLEVDGSTLRSRVNGRSYGIGEFEMASLDDLRARVAGGTGGEGRPRPQIVIGDVRMASETTQTRSGSIRSMPRSLTIEAGQETGSYGTAPTRGSWTAGRVPDEVHAYNQVIASIPLTLS